MARSQTCPNGHPFEVVDGEHSRSADTPLCCLICGAPITGPASTAGNGVGSHSHSLLTRPAQCAADSRDCDLAPTAFPHTAQPAEPSTIDGSPE